MPAGEWWRTVIAATCPEDTGLVRGLGRGVAAHTDDPGHGTVMIGRITP
ncbi:hypothetical protein J7E93_28450 [Streptomyces sp. ISL-36]|nr:hypothetical protein [Streptomyces sp. ISL-36]MBT2443957.1 hypothetical protein [Streptomyces sp. ISL-36]